MHVVRLLFMISLAMLNVVSEATASSDAALAIRAEYPTTKVTDNVYVIYGPVALPDKQNQGFRNNPAFVLTDAGTVVIDPGSSVHVGEMVVDKLRTITDKPVIAVFDTHSHGDHWLGNGAIKNAYPNAVIYAHPRMKALAHAGEGDRWIKMLNERTEGAVTDTKPVGPEKAVNHGDVVTLGDMQFRIYHSGTAHTTNDIMIEVVEEKVLFVGDVVRNQMLGIMEDGSFKGNIAAIDLALSSPAEHFIPGHARAGGREIVVVYRDYLTTLYNTVKALYEEGLSDYEMKPKVATALSAYKEWVGFDVQLGPYVSQVYLEVEAEAF